MKRTFIWVSLLTAILLVAMVGVLTTGAGLRLVARIVLPMIPGQLSYESIEGRIIGPLQASQLTWQNDDRFLRIEKLDFDWQPVALASRHLHFPYLRANGLHWRAPEADTTPSEKTGFSLPRLPLKISTDALQIDDILIDQGTESIPVHSIQIAGRLENERYSFEKFVIQSDTVDISGSGALGVRAPHAIDTELSWIVHLADQDTPIHAVTSAHGDTERLELLVTTDSPFGLKLSGTANNLLDDPSIAGQLDLNNLDPAIAGLDLQTGQLSASLKYTLAPDTITVSGRILAATWPNAAIIEANIKLGADAVEIRQLKASLENLATTVVAKGTARTDLSDMNLELAWTELVWPPGDNPQFSSPSGVVSLTGSKDHYALQLDGKIDDGILPGSRVALRGEGTSTQFNIANINAVFAQGELSGHGVLDWRESPKTQLELKTRDLDLSQWQDKLEGRLGFDGTVVASLPPEGARISVDVQNASGNLRGQTLTAKGTFEYAPGLLRLSKVDVRAGESRIEANGRVGADIDLDWNLSVPDIALLLPGSAGLVRSQGKATGKRNSPGLLGDLHMEDVSIGTFKAGRVNGDFDIGINADAAAHIELSGSSLEIGSFQMETFASKSDGTVAKHTIVIEIDGPLGRLTTSLDGGISDETWQGQIAQLTAERADVGIWQLANPSPLKIRRDLFALRQVCLEQNEAQLCGAGEFSTTQPWRSEFQLTTLPIQLLAPLLPPDLSYDGFISGEGHVASIGTSWSGAARLQLSDGQVLTRENDEDNILIAHRNGLIDADFDAAGIKAKMSLDLRDAGEFDADITIPMQTGHQLGGTVTARIENLSIVTVLVPQIGRIDGRLVANLVLAGTASAPDLSGQIGLQTTELVLPDFGIALKDTVVNVVTQGNDLRFDGSAESGEGRVSLTGDLRWQQGVPFGQLKIDGDKFRAVDLPEIRLDASPALVLTVNGRDISITGEISVPSAQITPIDIGSGSTVSSDQVIIGQVESTGQQTPWQINGNVQVTAGDDVQISGFGLVGKLTGSVLVIESPNQPTVGRGSLEIIDGRYRAYGQELKIETGRLTFTGGQIDDPGLNLLATRTAGEVIAGAQVRGALRAPVLTLYSVPAMSDTQAMSYLITGRGLEDLNELDQSVVSDTATRLALRGGSVLASSLGRGLGLDSVEVKDSGETASTALVVGKHISPRLFVSYGIGLFEAINTVRLRYRINSRLTLETQSGARTSADLLFSIER